MTTLCSPSKFIELKTPGPNYESTTEPPKNATSDPIFIEQKKETTPFFAYWFKRTDPNEVINDDEIFWFTGEAIEGDYFRTESSLDEYLGLETSCADESPLPSALSPESEVESPTLSPTWNNLPEPDWENLPMEPLIRHRSSVSHYGVAGESSPLKRSADVSFQSLESVPWGERSPNWDLLPLPPLSENDGFDEPLPSLTEARESTISGPRVGAETNTFAEFETSRPTAAVPAFAPSHPIATNNNHILSTCTDVVPYIGPPKNQKGWNGSVEACRVVEQSGAVPQNQALQTCNMRDFTFVNNGKQEMYIYNKAALVSMNFVGRTYMSSLRYQGLMRGEGLPLQAAMAEDQFPFPNPVFPRAQNFYKQDMGDTFQNHVFL